MLTLISIVSDIIDEKNVKSMSFYNDRKYFACNVVSVIATFNFVIVLMHLHNLRYKKHDKMLSLNFSVM